MDSEFINYDTTDLIKIVKDILNESGVFYKSFTDSFKSLKVKHDVKFRIFNAIEVYFDCVLREECLLRIDSMNDIFIISSEIYDELILKKTKNKEPSTRIFKEK